MGNLASPEPQGGEEEPQPRSSPVSSPGKPLGRDVERLHHALLNDPTATNRDFSNMNLSNGNFEDKDLRKFIFEGANFTYTNLKNANLQQCRLKNAKFHSAHLERADLRWARIQKAKFIGTHLEHAKLNKALLMEADFRNAHLEHANLSGAILRGAKFISAHLQNAKLFKAKLNGVNFDRTLIDNCDFSEAIFSPFRPLRSRAFRGARKSWRVRAVAEETGKTCLSMCLSGNISDDDTDDDTDDDFDSDDVDNNDDDGAGDDDADKILQSLVEDTTRVWKATIVAVNLCLEMIQSAVDQSLPIALDMDTNKVLSLVQLLIEELVVKFFHTFDFNTPLQTGYSLAFLNAFRSQLKEKHQVDIQEFNSTSTAADERLLQKEIEEFSGDVKVVLKEIFQEMKKSIERNISSDKMWWKDIKNILQKPPHDTYDEEVPTATALEMKRDSINRLLISSLDGIVSKLLRNHFFDKTLGKILPITEKRLQATEMLEKRLIGISGRLGEKVKKKFKSYFPEGSIRRKVVRSILKKSSKYSVSIGDNQTSIGVLLGAVRFSRMELNTDEAELNYVLDKLVKIEEIDVTADKWRDAAQTWISLVNLRNQMKAEKSVYVIDCIASDKGLIKALSSANALSSSIGSSNSIAADLSNNPGRHIRDYGYRYQRAIRQEIARIQKVREFQILFISFIGTAFASSMIALFNYIFQLAGDKFTSWWWLVAIVIGGIIMLLCITFGTCFMCNKGSRSSAQNPEVIPDEEERRNLI